MDIIPFLLGMYYVSGIIYYYPKTTYLDMNYTPSWESLMCFIWFIYFPIKHLIKLK